jgi:CheY-like chemotaxis protein
MGAVAAIGTAFSGITLVGLVVWVVRRSRVAEPPAQTEPAQVEPAQVAQTEAAQTEPAQTEPVQTESENSGVAPTQEMSGEALVPETERPEKLAVARTDAPGPVSGLVTASSLEEIAHDINNLMTVVVTHTELLRERHVGQTPVELEPILAAASKLSGLARKLLSCAERQRVESPASVRAALIGPGIVSARRESVPAARDSMPSILDAVEAVRDSDSAVRESHSVIASTLRPVAGTRGAILLVEDEEVLLRATRRMLEQRGYRVLTATSGPQALDRAFEGTDIDVLITDLSLPGMDGKELARRLRWIVPELAVLYMSGYDAATSGLTLAAGGREAFLPKPFTPRELAERLTELCGPEGREPIAQPG